MKQMLKPFVMGLVALSLLIPAVGALAKTRTDGPYYSKKEIKEIVVEEALLTDVPPALAMALAKVESNFDADAESNKGARGVMQIMPETAWGEFGVHRDDLWDARVNVQLGLEFLSQLYHAYGKKWDLALSHYNGGSLKKKGNGKFKAHSYTKKYVNKVNKAWDKYQDDRWVNRQIQIAGGHGWDEGLTDTDNRERSPANREIERASQREKVRLTLKQPRRKNIRSRYYWNDNRSRTNRSLKKRLDRARSSLDDFS